MEHVARVLKQRGMLELPIGTQVAVEIQFGNRTVEATKASVYLHQDESWRTYTFNTGVPDHCAINDRGSIQSFKTSEFISRFESDFNTYLDAVPPNQEATVNLIH